MANITCYIKAQRGKQGLINIRYNFTNMPNNDTWCHCKLSYRNSGGHFLPYLVNVDFDFCTNKIDLESSVPSVLSLVVHFLSKVAKLPFITKGCPMQRGANIIDLNFEDIKKNYFPPIIPEGRFLLYWRLYFGQSNHTIFEIKQHFQVKSTGVMQLSMLNMGWKYYVSKTKSNDANK